MHWAEKVLCVWQQVNLTAALWFSFQVEMSPVYVAQFVGGSGGRKNVPYLNNRPEGLYGLFRYKPSAGRETVALAAATALLSVCCLWEQGAHLEGDRKCLGASLPVYEVCLRRESEGGSV